MCVGPFKPKTPAAPPPPAPPPAQAPLSAKTVDFDAVDTDSEALAKKKKGKDQFKVQPKQNALGTNLVAGSGLSIPKK